MDRVEIVPIAQGHIESFHRALDTVVRERRYLGFLETPPLETTRAFVLGNIEQGHPQLVALFGGDVVGWCDVTRKPGSIYAHSGILGMGVVPAFRRKGIGKYLIRRTLGASREFGFHRVELTVRESNIAAIALYKSVGFEIEGIQRNAILVEGAYENLIAMAVLF